MSESKRYFVEVPTDYAHLAKSINHAVSLWFLGGYFVKEQEEIETINTKKIALNLSRASRSLIDEYCFNNNVNFRNCVNKILVFANAIALLPEDTESYILEQNRKL